MLVKQAKAKPAIEDAIGLLCAGDEPSSSLAERITRFSDPSPLQREILDEIPLALESAAERKNGSGLSDVLALVGSWGDTYRESQVLEGLRAGAHIEQVLATLPTPSAR